MQPPKDLTTPTNTSVPTNKDNIDPLPNSEQTKKRKSETKNKQQQQPEHQMKLQVTDSVRVKPVRIAASSTETEPKVNTTRSPGMYRGKCLYQSRKCENERAVKRNGKPHNLCEEHRSKQNQHQRKFDAKKFSRKRRRGSDSDEEIGVKTPSKRRPGASLKHSKADKQEADTMRTQSTMLLDATVQSNYLPQYVVETAPMSTPSPHVLSISYPRGVAFPSLPESVNTQFSPTSIGAKREVYISGHSGPWSSEKPLIDASHRPYLQLQAQDVAQAPTGYSQSELVAAIILVQPSSALPTLSAPSTVPSGTRYYNTEPPPAIQSRGPSVTTPRLLPSLMVPPTPLRRSVGIGPSPAQILATTSVPPVLSVGNILPPLTSITPRESPSPASRQNE